MLSICFGALPLLSPLLNTVAIPLVSVLLTPLALIGVLCPWDGPLQLAIWLSDQSLHLLDAAAPATLVWPMPISPWPLRLLAASGVAWLIAPRGLPGRSTGLLLMAPLLLYRPPTPAPGTADVELIDIGQGLSMLVRTADHSLLFDTGAGDAQRLLLPQLHGLGVKGLDIAIASHHDSDHDGALPSLLTAFPVTQILAGQPQTINDSRVQPCQRGRTWVWDGVRFDILGPLVDAAPANDNAASCILRIATARQALIVSGDLPAAGEAELVERYGNALRSDILVAGHHGSKTSTSNRYLDTVNPASAWISAGYRNRYHHPHPVVLERLQSAQVAVWRTDQQGALHATLGLPDAPQTDALRSGWLPFWRMIPANRQ